MQQQWKESWVNNKTAQTASAWRHNRRRTTTTSQATAATTITTTGRRSGKTRVATTHLRWQSPSFAPRCFAFSSLASAFTSSTSRCTSQSRHTTWRCVTVIAASHTIWPTSSWTISSIFRRSPHLQQASETSRKRKPEMTTFWPKRSGPFSTAASTWTYATRWSRSYRLIGFRGSSK